MIFFGEAIVELIIYKIILTFLVVIFFNNVKESQKYQNVPYPVYFWAKLTILQKFHESQFVAMPIFARIQGKIGRQANGLNASSYYVPSELQNNRLND